MFNSIRKNKFNTLRMEKQTVIQNYRDIVFGDSGNKKTTLRMYQTLHFFRQVFSQSMSYVRASSPNFKFSWAMTTVLMMFLSFNIVAFNPIKDANPKSRVIKTHKGIFSHSKATNSKSSFLTGTDVGISKSSDKTTAAIGDQVTFTLKVYNEGTTDATNVVVNDPIPSGTSYLSSSPNGAYNIGAGTWSVGTVPSGDTLTFSYTVQIDSDGVAISEAEVASMTETDDDSTPNNGNPSEDDWSSACVSIPMYFCNSSQIELEVEAPAAFASVRWYKDGNLVDTNRVYTIKDFGNYHYEATTGGPSNCPVELCCPIEVKQKCMALGNLVWADVNNDGIKNNDEIGIENIEVVLYSTGLDSLKNANDIALDTILTDGNGNYLFSNLPEGNYYVKLQDVPVNYSSSTGEGIYDNDHAGPYENGADPDNNINNNDDGTEMVGTGMIMSDVVTLTYDSEPDNDDDTDNNTNTTIDFGLYESQKFDLALNKTLAANQPSTFNLGDNVTFTFNVFNQGTVKAYNIEVVDYIPNGLSLNDSNWSEIAGKATAVIDSIEAGEVASLDITFTISNSFTGTSIMNIAEISDADDDKNPNNTKPTDSDSTPDDTDDNDGNPKDNEIDEDGKNGGDEDDHDIETIPVIQPNPTLSLGNLVWNDENNNGIKDSSEDGIQGIQVVLYDAGFDGKDSTDIAIDTLLTNINGNYVFSGLDEGIYYVKLTGEGIPFGMVSSNGLGTPYQAGNGSHEPGIAQINNQDNGTQMGVMIMSDTVHLIINNEPTNDGDSDSNSNLTIDFGLHKPVLPAPTLSIGNLVWNDVDNNGLFDNGEEGISNVEIILYDAGDNGKDGTDIPVDTVYTDINGNYLFDGLPEGNYYVKLTGEGIPQGWYSSTGEGPEDYDLLGQYEPASSNDINEVDNGTMMGVMVMSDIVELTEGAEPDDDGDTDTNTNLTIDFGFFRPDTFDLALNKRLADGQSPIISPGDTLVYTMDVTNLGNVEGVDVVIADYLPADLILADTNWVDINGIALLISPIPSILPGQTASVNIITIVNPDFEGGSLANFASIDIPIDSFPDNDTDIVIIDVRKNLLSLGDLVWADLDNDGQKDGSENGIPGVVLELYNAGNNGKDATDTLKATTTTDNDGFYLFQNLQAGNYYVKITGGVPLGYISSTGNGPNDPGTNGNYEPSTASDANNQDNGTQMGSMIMSNIVVLEYDKEPKNDGDNDETTNLTVDFGLYKPVEIPAGLSGIAFVDCNNDGVSTGDSPLSGVTVTLIGGNAPQVTTTDQNGVYTFGAVDAGTYSLTFSKPVGLDYTTENEGSNDAIDSDVDETTGSTASFTLTAGQDAAFDAGYADKEAPTFITVVPLDATVECNAVPNQATLFATDTYDNNVTVAISETKADGSCTDNYIITRTWTASDDCGNTATAQQRITVRDTQAPSIVAPNIRDLTVECGNVPSVPTGITATDNCDDDVNITYTENRLDGNCDESYVIVRTWTATDNCGNESPFVQRITVQDIIAPEFTTTIDDLTVECDEVPSLPAISATDNCDNDVRILVDEDNIDGNCDDSYTIVRTWTAVDDCGNTATLRQNITVRDTKAPTFSNAPASVTINCGQTVNTTPTVTDNCDKNVEVKIDDSAISGDCLTGRSATRTYTATDNCGNKATFVQTIYVVDNQAPVLAGTPANVTVTCKELPPPAKINVQDNCPDAVMIMFDERKTSGDNCTGYIITRTWTAMDACGNTASYQQNITILGDFVAPVISGIPANADYDCADIIPTPATASVSDDCDNNPKITFTEDKLGDGCGYKLIRIWTATDACGNKSSKEQIITVRDRTAPIITGVPSDLTVDCADALPPVGNPIASDACDNSVNLVYNGEQVVGDKDACEYQVIRTWTATDKCGNSTSKSQTIRVRDTKAPTVTPTHPMFAGIQNGGTITIECDKDLVIMDENDATATDNCDKNPKITFEEFDAKKGDCDVDGYSYKISCRWIATDKCGNSSSFVVHVVIKDTKAPVFSSTPANVNLNCGETIPSAATPSVTDNCDASVDVVFSENTTPGSCPGTSTIRRTWTATDDCGNKSTVSQTITIEDKVAPVIINVPTNQTVACGQTPSDAQKPSVSDNCDANVTLTYSDATSTNGGCLGSIVRTWVATDDCGNVATAQQIITIEDKVAPVLSGVPANQSGLCDAPANTANVTATDNCDKDVKIDYKEERQGTGCNYTLVRTWTATDDCGNTTSAQQTISVEDKVAPVLSGVPANSDASCDYVATPINVTATDNCDKDVKIDYKESKVGQGCQYKLVRTWTATDDCGNTAEGSQVVNVSDTNSPTISLPITDITLDCKDIASIPTAASATDDCDKDVTITHKDDKIGSGCTYQIKRTFTATDDCNNTATAVLNVTVQDNTAPVITFTDPILVAANPGDTLVFSCDKLPAYNEDTAEATDDCNGIKITKNDKKVEFKDVVLREGNCLTDGYLHLLYCEWKATDNCGNYSTWHMYVKVVDTKKPVLVGVPNDMTLNCGQTVPAAPTVTATDNCTIGIKVNYSETPFSGPCVMAGSVIRTWTATDDCGNAVSSSQRITITDNEKPELIGVPTADITLGENDPNPSISVKAVDKCDTDVTTTITDSKVANDCEEITTYVILAKDDCGNETSATYRVIRKKTKELTATISISTSPEICNKKDGSVVMTPSNYTYNWADGFNGATRSDLAAANYTVTVTDGNCASKVITVNIGADCPPVCVKPKMASSNITKNGCGTTPSGAVSFTLENANNNDYNFAWNTANGSLTSATSLVEGTYSVTVTQKTDPTCFEVFTFAVSKEDCPPVCVKPSLDGFNTTESGCGTAGTGSIIFNLKDGNVSDYTFVWSTPLGSQNIANGLTEGQYSVTVTRKSDITCFDEFTFNVGKKAGIDIFTDDALTLEITDCQNGKASVCANLTPSDITNALYTFTDNGAPFLGSFKGCQFDTTFYYNPKLTAGQNPYLLTGWAVNGKTLTGEFNTVNELVTLMNSLDKNSNWILTPTGNISGGNRANVYGRMDIRSKNNPTSTTVIELETKLTPYKMALQVGEGTHIIVATSIDGCTDEIKVKVECKPLPPDCKQFILWETENVFTNCGTPAKICYEELPFTQIADMSILDNGTAYTGGTVACTGGGTELTLSNGVHQLIFIKKDGCRDTSTVKVACTSARLVKDTVYVAQKDTICLDVAELLGDIKNIKNIWPNKSGEHAKFELIPGSRCVTCLGIEAGGTDEAAYIIEDTKGVFDTTYFQITVLERVQAVPSPEAVADEAKTKEGEAMILDVLANDKLGGAKLTTIKIVDQPKNGTVIIDQYNRVVFTPKPDFCNDEEDVYFSYQICTIGGCDDAPVTIKVLCNNIKVYTGFSPNGDGVNDFFYIEGANADSENKLSVFNRWGNQVFYKEGYRNEWGGTWDGKQLPDGTYFYLYEDGKGNKKAGYVQIQR